MRSPSIFYRPKSPSSSSITSASMNDAQTPPSVDSNFVLILASLLCALICVIGLVAVARCAWIRRLSARTIAQPPLVSFQTQKPKGIKKKILKSLPRETFSPNLSCKLTECAICLSEFFSGEEIRVLPLCGHGFHVTCIDTWLATRSSCPSCRRTLVVTRCQNCGGMPPPQTSIRSPSLA